MHSWFAFHCVPKLKFGELWPVNSYLCDKQKIDTLLHDLIDELKEHEFKTSELQESRLYVIIF